MSGRVQPMRPAIEQSWRRAQLAGLGPEDFRPSTPVSIGATEDRLLSAAQPVLDRLSNEVDGTDTIALLANHDARMIAQIAPTRGVQRQLDSLGYSVGSDCSEQAIGTSGLGTSIAIERPIHINSDEHYLLPFKQLSCYGRPLFHPVTGRLVGSICLTNISALTNPLVVPILDRVVGDIEQSMADRSNVGQRALADAFRRTVRRDIAIAAIGDDIVLTNRRAADLLNAADISVLRALASDPVRPKSAVELVLAADVPVQVRIQYIADTGAIFHIRPARSASATLAGGYEQLSLPRSARQRSCLAVTGESGTGRSATAAKWVAPLPFRSIDAAEPTLDGHLDLLSRTVHDATESGAVVVVENAHLLDARGNEMLRSAVKSPHGPGIVIITPPAEELDRRAAALLALCHDRIELAPLRSRFTEIPAIVRTILGETAPQLHTSGRTLEILMGCLWPGNITELRTALENAASAAAVRGSRSIDPCDFPSRYVNEVVPAANLSVRDRAERVAIIDSLAATHGNKARAAKLLGMSRTTLYARLRALDIPH